MLMENVHFTLSFEMCLTYNLAVLVHRESNRSIGRNNMRLTKAEFTILFAQK